MEDLTRRSEEEPSDVTSADHLLSAAICKARGEKWNLCQMIGEKPFVKLALC